MNLYNDNDPNVRNKEGLFLQMEKSLNKVIHQRVSKWRKQKCPAFEMLVESAKSPIFSFASGWVCSKCGAATTQKNIHNLIHKNDCSVID